MKTGEEPLETVWLAACVPVQPNVPPSQPAARAHTPIPALVLDGLVALSAVLVFGLSLTQPLVQSWDDARFLVEFAPVHEISWSNFVTIWSERHFEAYQPLHLLSYWLDVPLFGASGPVQHGVNLLLWCGALIGLRRILVQLKFRPLSALAATLFFGLHPIHVESVAWATGRKDVLMWLFAFGSISAFLRSRPWASCEPDEPDEPERQGSAKYHVLSALLYLCAVLSKSAMVMLPLVLIALELWGGPKKATRAFMPRLRRALIVQAPLLAIGAALSITVALIWQEQELIRPVPAGIFRLQLVGYTWMKMMRVIVYPLHLSPLYEIHRVGGLGVFSYLPFLVLPFLLWWMRTRPRLFFALLTALLLALPVSNLVPLYWESQDRYAALPLFGVVFAIAYTLDQVSKLPKRFSRVARAVTLVLLGLLAARTVHYEYIWRSDMTLWRHATQVQPRAYYAWLKYGEQLRDQERYADAVDAYDHAIALQPSLRLAHASRFGTLIVRDENDLRIARPQSLVYAARYLQHADDHDAMIELASDMASAGYERAMLVPLGRALDLEPATDLALERAAERQQAAGKDWLAEFYRERLRH